MGETEPFFNIGEEEQKSLLESLDTIVEGYSCDPEETGNKKERIQEILEATYQLTQDLEWTEKTDDTELERVIYSDYVEDNLQQIMEEKKEEDKSSVVLTAEEFYDINTALIQYADKQGILEEMDQKIDEDEEGYWGTCKMIQMDKNECKEPLLYLAETLAEFKSSSEDQLRP